VVDLGAVFKNHVGFQAAMEKLKNEVMASEITLGAEQDRIKGLMKQLKGFDSGTAEYKKLEADVATAMGDWSVTARLQKEAFYARQFQLHGQFYAEIEKAVEQYARANRITAVLRDKKVAAALRQPKAAPADNVGREQIREWIQNPVVYVAPVEAGRHDSSDITPEIIALVNGTAGR
jgi:Skp family chaperone for outer membrane proteins